MGNQSLIAACVAAVCAMTAVVALPGDQPPLLPAHAAPAPRTAADAETAGRPVGPQPLAAALAAASTPTAPAAPLSESARANLAAPTPMPMRVAIGRDAAHAATTPLWHAFAAAGGREVAAQSCTDRDAIELMLLGRAEMALVGVALSPNDLRAGLRQTQLGVELFALAANPASTLRSLTREQVRQVLTGQVTKWSQLGRDGGDIAAMVPADPGLAARAAKALIPGDPFASVCLRAVNDEEVAVHLAQHPGAVAVVRLGSATPPPPKLLQIDWIAPSLDAFGYGTYPFGAPLTLVTSGPAAGTAQQFATFATSGQGRSLLRGTLAMRD